MKGYVRSWESYCGKGGAGKQEVRRLLKRKLHWIFWFRNCIQNIYWNSTPCRHFPKWIVSTMIRCHLFVLIIESAWTPLPVCRLLSPAAWFIFVFYCVSYSISTECTEQYEGGKEGVCLCVRHKYRSLKPWMCVRETKDGMCVHKRQPTECVCLYQSTTSSFAISVALKLYPCRSCSQSALRLQL